MKAEDMLGRLYNLTEVDKDYIVKQSRLYNLPFNEHSHCANCWADQALLLILKERKNHGGKQS